MTPRLVQIASLGLILRVRAVELGLDEAFLAALNIYMARDRCAVKPVVLKLYCVLSRLHFGASYWCISWTMPVDPEVSIRLRHYPEIADV